MFYLFIFIFGTIIGSFLNVVVIRTHDGGRIIKSRSQCPHCQHVLGTIDLIPLISFISQSGQCRYCRQPIAWQYPLVELVTGFLFVLVTYNIIGWLDWENLFYNSAVFLIWLRNLIFVGFLIIIFIYDLKWYLILDKITWPAMVIALILNLIIGFSWLDLLLGAVVGFGFFALQYIVSNGRWIGGGDLRLGALAGLMLGLKAVIVALFFAYIIGALISVFLLIWGRKELKSQIPFGTFLALGIFLALLWSQEVINWYLSIL
ncbi:MAG: hypothetical protein A3B89_03285 [Candidatus Buchananbacteria bacterium RIFCSPHIGHO2_02_FULL_40_13]|uniref:Prepilin peptidase n=1 Tax=Candidatus Buchananbacteria bacterium RIFCSPLOWO2_01_FULL_39_33 TaxID=1797543 RepID=A0A1G1YGP6_9BACT|nr:MAG: hypothetical protein A2820_01530 [Candidatus Buchananbacteria bacterium RIFCSPHIGHO2_01_FULL_40_35]OGY50212.1 MAG: hypothetical protein A3B89_03285 [Candidatus Buchananbacteria bacterium RIFCSPHIGHO2_02_FULL_40_13]OGY51431.1 MAG: hypothetical protein A3A02_04560 [Candidatus Buchananbacteria bacterium RIFCSPLOWO2_01_FULL_39_33]